MLAMMAAGPAPAFAPCLPLFCKFTENGKKGRYLDTDVSAEKLAAADAIIATGQANGRLMGAQSINRGEFAGTGLDMPKTSAALEAMLVKIAANWKYRPTGRMRVRITGSSAYAPATHPDGVIVVPMGVLMRSKSDDEVVWLLSHELSHAALGHFEREAKASHATNAVNKAVMALQVGTDVSQVRVDNSSGKLRFHTVTDADAQHLADSIWAKGDIVVRLIAAINQFFSRTQEDQADVAGLDLAIAAGYSSAGASNALRQIESDENRLAATRKSLGGELTAYTKATGAEAVQKALRGADLNATAHSLLDGLIKNGLQIGLDYVEDAASQSHRPAPKRLSGVADYYKNAHKKVAAAPENFDWLEGIQATDEYKDAAKAVAAHDSAILSLDGGGANAAQAAATDLQPALGTRYVATPLIANLRARIQERLGDPAGADRIYSQTEKLPSAAPATPPPATSGKTKGGKRGVKIAVERVPPSMVYTKDPFVEQTLDGFVQHVNLLVRKKDYARAQFVVGVARQRFGDIERFLPALVTISIHTRQVDLFATTMTQCQDTENPSLIQKCQAAVLDDTAQDKLGTLSPADQTKVDTALRSKTANVRRASFWKRIGDQISGSED